MDEEIDSEEIDSGVVVLHHDCGELKMHDSRPRALDTTAWGREPDGRPSGLVLDYAAHPPGRLREAVRRMAPTMGH